MDGSNSSSSKPKQSRPVQVADAIKQWVVEHDLKQGDKLPNEGEMITKFGVSKGTVREALRILEAQGLILTKTGPGGGSIVDKVSAERARALLANYFYFQDLSVADVYQLRKVLEPELVASLAGKLDAEQLDKLQLLANRHPQPARDADEEKQRHIASLEFHAQLAEYAANPLLGFVIGFMSRILTDLTVFRGLYDPPNLDLWRKGREHQLDLVAALRAGDADAARKIMTSHMKVAEAFMQDQEVKLMRRFVHG